MHLHYGPGSPATERFGEVARVGIVGQRLTYRRINERPDADTLG